MGLLAKSGKWLAKKMQQATTDPNAEPESLVYKRAADGSEIDLTNKAWVGNAQDNRRDPPTRGPSVEWGDRDYLIPAKFLPAEPQLGDWLIEKFAHCVVTFEIMTIPGEPAWRWGDDERKDFYRVHTKEVKKEPRT